MLHARARGRGAQHLRGVSVRGWGVRVGTGVGGLRLGAGLLVAAGSRRRRGASAHVVDLHAVLLLGVLQQGPRRTQRQTAGLAHELGRFCNTRRPTYALVSNLGALSPVSHKGLRQG